MIPIRLELKNFMSYGDQVMPLDFRGMHLACLSGDNGHGKSALLDAITWCLWGEGRGSSDELIRLGTEEMRVTFDFSIEADVYRVIRGRSKRSAGNIWEAYIQESDGGFRAITGHHMKDTGRIIQRVLRMDYKTFINSAYIQQGRADEFTKQTVADRKKILADILDLSRYDALEAKSKDRRNAADVLVQDLTREIDAIASELVNEDSLKTQLAESKVERETLEAEVTKVEANLLELQTRGAELSTAADRARQMERQVAEWRREVEGLITRKSEQEIRVARGREMLKEKDRILAGAEKLRTSRELLIQLDSRLEELRRLEHTKSGLEQSILMEQHKLDLLRQSLVKEFAELETKTAAAPGLEADAKSLRAKVEALDRLDTYRVEIQNELTAQSDQLGLLKAEYENLVKKSKPELEEKLRMIADPGAKCPLCGTELGHEKHDVVVGGYKKQIADLDASILDLKTRGSEAKKKRDAAGEEIKRIEGELKAGMEIRKRLAQAEQMLFSIDEYRKQLPDVKKRLDDVVELLQSSSFATEAREQLTVISGNIAALEYDADSHARIKSDITSLMPYEKQAVQIRTVEENLPADELNLKAIADLIDTREKSIAECREQIDATSKTLEELTKVNAAMEQVSVALSGLRDRDRDVTGRIATLEHRLTRCKALHKEVADKRKALDKAKADKAAYAELVAAFGKKGVQALIIENAIPEIQEEANRLLARMTDNAMQISIETVKDKKTGGTAETLDIRISDDMGTRSYELYSGGEAFRVNFALRIALSKLLARRAGARLQTLIIDEGFGTQDAKGREKLVDAIDSIKDDFELILVITHIDELKDAFPTRIEIAKDTNGSQINVA